MLEIEFEKVEEKMVKFEFKFSTNIEPPGKLEYKSIKKLKYIKIQN